VILPGRGAASIDAVAFDPEARQLVLLTSGKPQLINLETRAATPLRDLGTTSVVGSFAIGPRYTLFLEINGHLSLWDLRVQEKLADLHRGLESMFIPHPQQVAISEDGNAVAATLDGSVVIFKLSGPSVISRACAVAGGPLSRAEWSVLVQTRYLDVCQGPVVPSTGAAR
jgi:hypothetical protein